MMTKGVMMDPKTGDIVQAIHPRDGSFNSTIFRVLATTDSGVAVEFVFCPRPFEKGDRRILSRKDYTFFEASELLAAVIEDQE